MKSRMRLCMLTMLTSPSLRQMEATKGSRGINFLSHILSMTYDAHTNSKNQVYTDIKLIRFEF